MRIVPITITLHLLHRKSEQRHRSC
jgi:hypothetical protein